MERTAATATVQIDNDEVRVTCWDFPPGTETGWHRHAMNYVVVPTLSGTLQMETATGTTASELVAGQSYHRVQGAEHNVINASDARVQFVEIEFKQSA